MQRDLPRITWEEASNPAEAAQVADEIMRVLTSGLPPPGAHSHRLCFMTPTPAPYTSAEAAFLAAVAREGAAREDVRVIALPHGGRSYAFHRQELFKRLLPDSFRMGPPEMTLIVANSPHDLTAREEDLAALVLDILRHAEGLPEGLASGMHFDSGDLVEVF